MSVQFGRWNFDGQPTAPDYIEKVSTALAPYGPDSNESYSESGVNVLYRAFYTTKESRLETQPHISSSGAVITWDGRLDNRAELITDLQGSLTVSFTDVDIVAAAYEKWGTYCFDKLIGDWALSIWNPNNRSLILAKDPIGTHHLYYSLEKNHVTWSTILDPLVRFAGKTFAICEEYIAGWFSMFPAVHLTPYVGVHAVPPSSFVLLRPGRHTVSKYWDFDPEKKIRYRTDAEYEEHFRTVFGKAVQRKLRSDRPVLAELSGGMDSSSIVCMADTIIACGAAESPRLDTISWYDDSYDHIEPDWNERPYFTKVEEKRHRTGYHINLREVRAKEVVSQRPFMAEFGKNCFAAAPNSDSCLSGPFPQYAAYMMSEGHRVVLSGLGGESATGGGVPTPTPELQNLLSRARFFALARQLKAWAAKMRKSRLHLLWEAVRGFLPSFLASVPKDMCPVPWFNPGFVRRNHAALCGYPSRVKLFGPLPSFQHMVGTLSGDRRQMAFYGLRSELLRDLRYPYLDRDFLEFVCAIPWEQIVRVGKRRSLMKRSLVGIVPEELLNRRKKATVPHEPPKGISAERLRLSDIGQHIVGISLGIMDPDGFLEVLQKARHNEEVPMHILGRTLTLESWLRQLTIQEVLSNSKLTKRRSYSSHSERLTRPSKGSKEGSLAVCAAGESFLVPLGAKELEESPQPKSSAR